MPRTGATGDAGGAAGDKVLFGFVLFKVPAPRLSGEKWDRAPKEDR